MSSESYRFGPFVLDAGAYRLSKGSTPLDLTPKAIDLLLLLVRQPGHLVTKQDILAAVWPDVAVTDNALTQVISDLRQVLGDSASAPVYIETVARRGYRFKGSAGSAGSSGSVPRAILGVAEFSNVAGDDESAWLSAGIAETVTNDLRPVTSLAVRDRLPGLFARPEEAIDAARAAGLDLVVVGSFQRAGAKLRMTARVVDVRTGETRAQAKADGDLADVFALQDAMVTALSRGLQVGVSPAVIARTTARETASLDAYRALTEGRLKLEMLDPAGIPAAIAAFERALALDPRYALAQVGLAHARFWQFQATRARVRPDAAALAAAVTHAARAVALDSDLAEAHSALGFCLASAGRREEGMAAARRGLALEPGNWRHQFRLGMASWGSERLAWLDAVSSQYPALAYAYLGRAMICVARGDLARAEETLRAGAANERRAVSGAGRFPSSGLHNLLGLLRLAQGDGAGARTAFDRELQSEGSRLFADETTREAWTGHGWALLMGGDAAGAIEMFDRALTVTPDHPRAWIGLAAACRATGARDRAESASAEVVKLAQELWTGGRRDEAATVTALDQAACGSATEAASVLNTLLDHLPPGSGGWSLPVEPALAAMRGHAGLRAVLDRLAVRAQ